ncbi:MAG: serine/threonine protein kinase [Salinivirgaceae bacterium]|nr:serine/threonine protein kinase [Salinivirgaceae bacterium]
MKKKKDKIIVLHGENNDYLFKPHTPTSRFREVSKFSRVYKGESADGRSVVIKMLPSELAKKPEEIDHFKLEINWYGLHQNLLAPYEYIYQDDRHFLISDYYDGIDLSFYFKYIRVRKRTRIKIAIDCGLQLLNAVEALHNLGYIHADIKPANVLMATIKGKRPNFKNPEFQLIDFGMVRVAGKSPRLTPSRTKRPFVLVYSPPEQVLGFHELTSFHSDIHNIALLMYELITKEPAYESNISVKLMNLQMAYPLQVKKVIPPDLMLIIQKATSKYHFKKPPNHYSRSEVFHRLSLGIEQRYQTVNEFRLALQAFKSNYIKV